MAAGSRPPERAWVVHHRTDELLVQQHTVSDGQATSPVEGTKQTQSLCRLSSYLIDVYRTGKPSIKGHPEITCRFDPCDATQTLESGQFSPNTVQKPTSFPSSTFPSAEKLWLQPAIKAEIFPTLNFRSGSITPVGLATKQLHCDQGVCFILHHSDSTAYFYGATLK